MIRRRAATSGSWCESIKARRKTIILTTHYMDEAELLCDEIAIMDRGRIVAQGPPRQLLREHFAEVLLELPRQDFPTRARALPLTDHRRQRPRRDHHPRPARGRCARCSRRACRSRNLRIRPANLEDLFLELTGTELRP